MKTAIKLNKKELFVLYEKSSDLVKKNLRIEFGEEFFVQSEAKSKINISVINNSQNENKIKWFIDWEMIFDFTPIFRLAIYTCLLWIIFS